MAISSQKYKELSIGEFTKAADKYETPEAGIYNLCKNDYPDILAEIRKEPFRDLLDAGCGTAPMISLLIREFPEARYTGIDLTPRMIEVARAKGLPNTNLVCGDCENLPFPEASFDVIICSQSFHHYPQPQDFFNSVRKCLRPNGRLILRDMCPPAIFRWFCNSVEMPILNRIGYGDVRCYGRGEIQQLCDRAGLKLEFFERRWWFRLHAVIRRAAA